MTLQLLFGPRLTAVQLSSVTEKADEPVSVTFKAPVAFLPGASVSTNVFEAVVPELIVP